MVLHVKCSGNVFSMKAFVLYSNTLHVPLSNDAPPFLSTSHLGPTVCDQTCGIFEALKWDWWRVIACGRKTGVFRQTADRESN